jgi:hypothetical protein
VTLGLKFTLWTLALGAQLTAAPLAPGARLRAADAALRRVVKSERYVT